MIKRIYPLLLLIGLVTATTYAQTEFTTWGNLTGIRVDNQLMEFNTSLALENQWGDTWATRKEGQKTDFKRTKDAKTFTYGMGEQIDWEEVISSEKEGQTQLDISFSSKSDTLINGAYFKIQLPEAYDAQTTFAINTPDSFQLNGISSTVKEAIYQAVASGITIQSPTRKLHVSFAKPAQLVVKKNEELYELTVLLAAGEITANQEFENSFTIQATGILDQSPVNLKVFPEQEGKKFDGIGGNFRLQNPEMDPQVIDYCLENLRVTWGRVEIPWFMWQPNIDDDPIALAKKDSIHPHVRASMEMAQRLDKMGIPVILAGWFAPNWAIIGEHKFGGNLDGSRGNQLDQTKKEDIYKSLGSYIKYLRDAYGVETVMFSFNESDLGIDVRQTPEEHNILIKELGAYLKSQGLNTKLLMGDTADANGWPFTTVASTDPESRPYIGGVSFHSWRGWTDGNMMEWSDIANRVDAPLFIGEGSIDAGAWRYPQIFEEPTYALDEIDVYVKILNQAQPLTILQWQLTSDYSPLSGGGIWGNTAEKLHPTQRFFNLKQLGETPENIYHIPSTSDKKDVRIAAMGNNKTGSYAVHLVNKGASRKVTLSGLPQELKTLTVFVTNKNTSFKKVKTVKVANGEVTFELAGASYTSLMTK